jgi:hypothetical protein
MLQLRAERPLMDEQTPKFIQGNVRERILVALVSPVLGLFCIGGLLATHARFGGPSAPGWRSRLFDSVFLAIFSEMFIAFLALLTLAFIWALFRPARTSCLLFYARNHVWHALLLFLAGFAVSFVIAYIIAA